MKNRYCIQEKLNQKIREPVDPNDSFEMGKSRGWLDALEWVLMG